MSLWRYMAEVQGYNEAHDPEKHKKSKPMSDAEAAAISEWSDKLDGKR